MPFVRPLHKSKSQVSRNSVDEKVKEEIMAIIAESTIEPMKHFYDNSAIFKPLGATISLADYIPNRPKRSIERRNYNQTKLAKEAYNQNQIQIKTPSINTNKKKLDENKFNKSVERVVKQKVKKELKPPSDIIEMDKLMAHISPFKAAISMDPASSATRKQLESKESNDKLSKIIHRAFRYPWEWYDPDAISTQCQILGFRTLRDGRCETLMWSR